MKNEISKREPLVIRERRRASSSFLTEMGLLLYIARSLDGGRYRVADGTTAKATRSSRQKVQRLTNRLLRDGYLTLLSEQGFRTKEGTEIRAVEVSPKGYGALALNSYLSKGVLACPNSDVPLLTEHIPMLHSTSCRCVFCLSDKAIDYTADMSVSDTKVVIANLGQTLAIAHGAMLSAERTSAILKLADLAASNWAAPKPEQTPETKPKSETPTEPKIETVTQDLQGTRWKVIRFKKAGAQ